jgi:predicted MFS family arabinose efflux permease
LSTALIVLVVGSFAFGTDGFILAGMLPAIARDLDVPVGVAGQLVTAFALTSALTAPVIGVVTSSWRRRSALLTGTAIFIAGNALTLFSGFFPVILAGRAIAGAGMTMYGMSAIGVASELTAPAQRGRALALLQSGTTIAIVTSVPLGALLAEQINWRWTIAAITVASLAVMGGIRGWIRPGSRIPRTSIGERLRPLRDRAVLAILASGLAVRVAYYTPYTYIGILLADVVGRDAVGLPVFLLVLGISAMPGSLAAGYLVDAFGPRLVLMAATLVFAIDLALEHVATASLAGTFAFLVVFGFAGWMIGLPQTHALVGLAPESPAMVLGLGNSTTSLGAALGGVVGGVGIDLVGRSWLGPVAALFALLSLGFTLLASQRLDGLHPPRIAR